MQPHQHIVLTRQPEQAGPLETALQNAGVQVSLLPLIDFALPQQTTALEKALVQLRQGHYRWVVITSPNTVRALAALEFFKTPVAVSWAMVGAGTAQLFRERSGWEPDLVATQEQSGAGLVAEFPNVDGSQNIFLPVSEIASPTVEQGLSRLGYTVQRVTAYQNVPAAIVPTTRRLLAGQDHPSLPVVEAEQLAERVSTYSGIVLTSPSNVRAFVSHAQDFPALKLLSLVAIGNPTAAALAEHGLTADTVLRHPNAESILEWLQTTNLS